LQGISYAKLANLPPIIGLCKYLIYFYFHDSWHWVIVINYDGTFEYNTDSSFVPPLIYALLGSSRHVGVGPVSIASLVMGSMLSETVSFAQNPTLYLQLAFTATFVAGLFQASLGILRYWIQLNHSSSDFNFILLLHVKLVS